jgi:HK97 family phage portal protein
LINKRSKMGETISKKLKRLISDTSSKVLSSDVSTKGIISNAIIRTIATPGYTNIPAQESYDWGDCYSSHPFIYSSVYQLAMSAARAPLKLWEYKKDDSRKEIKFGIGYDLLHNPNEIFDNIFDLLEITFIWLELAGISYWVIDSKDGVWKDTMTTDELELWPLRPDRMCTILDNDRVVQGYSYMPFFGAPVPINKERVFVFRYGNPMRAIEGQAPTKAAALSIELELNAMLWNKNFLRKGANPDIIISVPGKLDEESKKAMVDAWVDSYQGVDSWPGIAVLDNEGKVEKLTLAPKDADWNSLRRLTRDELLTVWGVPPTILGLYAEGVNRSVADIQRTAYWEDTMMPKLEKFQINVTSKYLKRIHPTRNWIAEFDLSKIPALEEARATRDARWRANIIMGASLINEYRKSVGEKPVAWGDDRWINVSALSGGVPNTGAQPTTPASPDTNPNPDQSGGKGGKFGDIIINDRFDSMLGV